MAECPYVHFSANVASNVKPSEKSKNIGVEEKQQTKADREIQKAEREKRKINHQKQQKQQQQALVAKKGEKGRGSLETRIEDQVDGRGKQRNNDKVREECDDRPHDP